MASKIVIVCDGGCRKRQNGPPVAAYAYVVRVRNHALYQESGVVCLGRVADSMMAEYGAILGALRWVRNARLPRGARIDIQSDCRSVVDRLNGVCQVNRRLGLVMIHQVTSFQMAALRRRGVLLRLRHVARSTVAEADSLCTSICKRHLNAPDYGTVLLRLTDFLRLPAADREVAAEREG